MEKSKTLFDEFNYGGLKLRNRIVMASLTRLRCAPKAGFPTEMQVAYYSQRATYAGLIISESSPISPIGQDKPGSPGIFTQEQVDGWRKVVNAVHEKGCYMFLQLWHAGRTAHPTVIEAQNLGASPIAIRGVVRGKNIPHGVPKEMDQDDINMVIEQYRQAAIKAKDAGFDGVELQAANAFLVDQFLKDTTNIRTDKYGGSVENRCRFCLEIIDTLIGVWGAKRVGIKISPVGRSHDIFDSNPVALYSHLLTELDKRGIAHVQIMEPSPMHSEIKFKTTNHYGPGEDQIKNCAQTLRPFFKGTIICNNKLTPEAALAKINDGEADLVSFGRHYISNPDLPLRIKNGWPLAEYDDDTFYGGNEKGYTDYPCYDPQAASQKL